MLSETRQLNLGLQQYERRSIQCTCLCDALRCEMLSDSVPGADHLIILPTVHGLIRGQMRCRIGPHCAPAD